jgi:hypothetical protein
MNWKVKPEEVSTGEFGQVHESRQLAPTGRSAYAVGHAEIHRWRDPSTVRPVTYPTVQRVDVTLSPDLAFLAQKTPRGK